MARRGQQWSSSPEDESGSPVPLETLLARVEALLRRPGRLYWTGASPARPTLCFFWPSWFSPHRQGRFLETRRDYLEALHSLLCRIKQLRDAGEPLQRAEASRLEDLLRAELQERLTWYEIRPGPTLPPW